MLFILILFCTFIIKGESSVQKKRSVLEKFAEKAVQIFLDMGLTPPPKRTMSKTKQIFYMDVFPKFRGYYGQV